MMIQKLRLQRGWSQQQLAEMSGLSSRTIQRIERGETPSVESLKAIASAYNVDFNTLKEQDMDVTQNSNEEALAFKYVRKLKGFYLHLTQYLIVISVLTAINLYKTPHRLWVIFVILGWGLGLLAHAMQVFDRISPFGAEWEKRQVEKRLGRKL